MTWRTNSRESMIFDACVLIDFIQVNRTILSLIVKYLGPVHVISPVVDELRDIDDASELVELGVVVMEPEMEDAYAASDGSSPLSFADRLCLLTARRHGFTCVTNDKRLRNSCEQASVPVRWGLELLAALHKAGGIPTRTVARIAEAIGESNPKHIDVKTISRFKEIIRRQNHPRPRP